MGKISGAILVLASVAIAIGGIYSSVWWMFVLSVADMINSIKAPGNVDGMRVAIDILFMVLAWPAAQLSLAISFIVATLGIQLCAE